MDETRIIAWIDGELNAEESAEVEAAVAADPGLAAVADRHRRIRARFAAAFTPLLADPGASGRRRTAQIVSLTARREQRGAEPVARSAPSWRAGLARWRAGAWPAAAAACLLIGLSAGRMLNSGGIADHDQALALSPAVALALDTQRSGETGPVTVALSFRDQAGEACRSFVAQHVGGVACKAGGDWQLRYGAPVDADHGDYRMAGGDPASARVIAAMIAGTPLDAAQEGKAIAAGWR